MVSEELQTDRARRVSEIEKRKKDNKRIDSIYSNPKDNGLSFTIIFFKSFDDDPLFVYRYAATVVDGLWYVTGLEDHFVWHDLIRFIEEENALTKETGNAKHCIFYSPGEWICIFD